MSAEPAVTPPVTVDRLTVSLVRKAAEDLRTLVDRTGLSKTDLMNRAISLYQFIDTEMRNGRDLYVKDPGTGESLLIRFL